MTEVAPRVVRRYRAALEHYDIRRDALGYRDPVLPAETGAVHAVTGWSLKSNYEPEFKREPWWSECGAAVHLVLQVDFDGDDPDACPACVTAIASGRRVKVFQDSPCFSTVAPTMPGYSQMVGCGLPSGHPGPHRGEGASWTGSDDFTPDEYTAGEIDDH